MNNKGVTLIELLIVIVVMGIIAAMSVTAVSEALTNTRKNALVAQGDIFIEAARLSYNNNSDIWDDDKATLAELIADERIETIGKDPWGTEYILDQTYVTIEEVTGSTHNLVEVMTLGNYMANTMYAYKVRVVTETATIGYDGAMQKFGKEDVVFFNISDGSIFEQIKHSFDNDIDGDINTNEGDDEIDVIDDIKDGASITTSGGNDTVTVGDDIKNSSSVDLGSGDDTLDIEGEIRDTSNVETGEGNDTINIGDDIQDNSVVNTGDGNDTVTVEDDLQSGGTLNTGNGDDSVTVNDDLDDGFINTGNGDDEVSIEYMRDASEIDTGADDDYVFINSVSSRYDGHTDLGSGNDTLEINDDSGSSKDLKYTDGTFDGGAGYDILILSNVTTAKWNDYVSDLFTNFEEVRLKDGTINP